MLAVAGLAGCGGSGVDRAYGVNERQLSGAWGVVGWGDPRPTLELTEHGAAAVIDWPVESFCDLGASDNAVSVDDEQARTSGSASWSLQTADTQPQVLATVMAECPTVFTAAVVRDGGGDLKLQVLAGDPDNPTTIAEFRRVG